jgi:type II secretory ATPase GspE/PulE/Tfp pilus assembly ATPase PilB-like protein
MSPAVARVIVANPNERELRIAAHEQNILDMRQDGIVKVLEGITTLDELARVVDVDAEIL